MDFSILLNSLLGFGAYFGLSLVFIVVFKFAYALVTPHDEWKLIREDKSVAAAIGLGGALLGFAIALSGAASNSVSLIDFAIWGVVALLAQSIAFLLIRLIFMPKIVERIEANEVSAGIMLAATSVAVGLLNAACMTY